MRILNRVLLLSVLVILAAFASVQVLAQVPSRVGDPAPRMEVALDYTYLHANAPPGGCGCFSMNGGAGSFAFRISRPLSLVIEAGAVTQSGSALKNNDLTLATYLGGLRYSGHRSGRLTPFGELLAGVVHASGSLAPSALGLDSSTAFALSAGGGVDLRLSRHFAWRVVKAGYLLTRLPNGVNDRQNSFRLGTGIVVRFGKT